MDGLGEYEEQGAGVGALARGRGDVEELDGLGGVEAVVHTLDLVVH